MDYIFREWEKRLSAFESSVEKDLEEMRKCKAQIQQMQLNLVAEIKKGRYIYDEQRLVLSAPEIIIGRKCRIARCRRFRTAGISRSKYSTDSRRSWYRRK